MLNDSWHEAEGDQYEEVDKADLTILTILTIFKKIDNVWQFFDNFKDFDHKHSVLYTCTIGVLCLFASFKLFYR